MKSNAFLTPPAAIVMRSESKRSVLHRKEGRGGGGAQLMAPRLAWVPRGLPGTRSGIVIVVQADENRAAGNQQEQPTDSICTAQSRRRR